MALGQNNGVILQQLKLEIQKEDYSETISIQDTRYQHYQRQLDLMSVQDEIITRQYYDETWNVKYNQVLWPKHLVNKLLESLHGKAKRHPGIAKLLHEIRCEYYYPGIAKLLSSHAWSKFLRTLPGWGTVTIKAGATLMSRAKMPAISSSTGRALGITTHLVSLRK